MIGRVRPVPRHPQVSSIAPRRLSRSKLITVGSRPGCDRCARTSAADTTNSESTPTRGTGSRRPLPNSPAPSDHSTTAATPGLHPVNATQPAGFLLRVDAIDHRAQALRPGNRSHHVPLAPASWTVRPTKTVPCRSCAQDHATKPLKASPGCRIRLPSLTRSSVRGRPGSASERISWRYCSSSTPYRVSRSTRTRSRRPTRPSSSRLIFASEARITAAASGMEMLRPCRRLRSWAPQGGGPISCPRQQDRPRGWIATSSHGGYRDPLHANHHLLGGDHKAKLASASHLWG